MKKKNKFNLKNKNCSELKKLMNWIWNNKKGTSNKSMKDFKGNWKINKNYKISKMNLNFKPINLKIYMGSWKSIRKIIFKIFYMDKFVMTI